MRVIQFEIPQEGRRVGVVAADFIKDITAVNPEFTRVYDVFQAARSASRSFTDLLAEFAAAPDIPTLAYQQLHDAKPGGEAPFLHPPLDHADPHRVQITGTGLTHTGSMQSRDQMHSAESDENNQPKTSDQPKTDSAKMFEMGLAGGKPPAGERGVAPEWFYKGNGTNLRGHRAELEIPAFALDGGEEPELVGCYIIDERGIPRRLGFALGNEWSDHATEKVNYLYLAPSKLRTCAAGPELNTDFEFNELTLSCTVRRGAELVYDSGELYSGEKYMCHSLVNCEDHHFKYPLHRQPGDVHLHYFGTSKLSHSTRDWKYQSGDEIRIDAPDFGADLVNTVCSGEPSFANPIQVEPA